MTAMTQYQVTLNAQTLQRLFSGDSQLAQLLESILNQVLEAQVTEQVQAERNERTDERQGYRNGYKPRRLTTRVGTLTLRVPQVRQGGFTTELFARYQRSEQALILTLMQMVVNGVSTRKVAPARRPASTRVSKTPGGATSSQSSLSRQHAPVSEWQR
jgi:transposase-like protein